jgi:hypothetical protein
MEKNFIFGWINNNLLTQTVNENMLCSIAKEFYAWDEKMFIFFSYGAFKGDKSLLGMNPVNGNGILKFELLTLK